MYLNIHSKSPLLQMSKLSDVNKKLNETESTLAEVIRERDELKARFASLPPPPPAPQKNEDERWDDENRQSSGFVLLFYQKLKISENSVLQVAKLLLKSPFTAIRRVNSATNHKKRLTVMEKIGLETAEELGQLKIVKEISGQQWPSFVKSCTFYNAGKKIQKLYGT